jgi:hypothetical protein
VTSRIPFSRQLLAKAQEMVQAHFPEIRVIKDASLTRCGNCWMAWLSSKGVVELIGGQVFCRPLQRHHAHRA